MYIEKRRDLEAIQYLSFRALFSTFQLSPSLISSYLVRRLYGPDLRVSLPPASSLRYHSVRRDARHLNGEQQQQHHARGE